MRPVTSCDMKGQDEKGSLEPLDPQYRPAFFMERDVKFFDVKFSKRYESINLSHPRFSGQLLAVIVREEKTARLPRYPTMAPPPTSRCYRIAR